MADAARRVDVGIVLVGMNTREFVRNCLASIAKSEWRGYTHRIVYVDNASADDSVEVVRREFPDVTVVANPRNVHFCPAANQGARLLDARFILQLNNDTVVYPDSLAPLVALLDQHPRAGIAGCRLLNHDLTDQWSARRFPSGIHAIAGRRSIVARLFPNAPVLKDYLFKDQLRGTEPFRVDWVGTPCMLVRSQVYWEAGGLPEEFYYWHEATFCHRVLRLGWETWVVPTSKVVHFEGMGGGARSYQVRQWHVRDFHDGALRFLREQHGLSRAHPMSLVAGAALESRKALLLFRNWLTARRGESTR
jgi:GT2 family glycosyltransferase